MIPHSPKPLTLTIEDQTQTRIYQTKQSMRFPVDEETTRRLKDVLDRAIPCSNSEGTGCEVPLRISIRYALGTIIRTFSRLRGSSSYDRGASLSQDQAPARCPENTLQ